MPLSTINSNSFSTTANTNIDNGALFIDAVNGRVGAGTTAPLSQLHAKGAGSGTFAPYNDPLVVEGSDYTYLHLKSSNNQAGVIYNRGGSTGWFHGLDNSGNLKTVYMSAINGTGITNAKDGTAAMLIDSSNRVTKPLQPYCLVGKSNGNVSAQNTIIFNDINANVGSHYNATNGRFTAPIAGYYFISLNVLGSSTSGVEAAIKRNGSTVLNSRDAGGTSNYVSTSAATVISMAANDYLTVYVEGSYGVLGDSGYGFTSMTAYLLG